jgi:hypothetical protein
MSETLKKLLKIAAGIFATIVLGAIGSGLWERFLGPFLDWLTRQTIGAFAWGHTSYRDSIYENAAKGFHEVHSLALYMTFLGLLPIAYLFLLQRHPTERRPEGTQSPMREFIRSRKGYWFIFALTMAVFVAVTFSALRLRHINETITYSLSTFEIVRPYVGEREYTKYRSRFFAIRTASEFDALHAEVVAVAKTNNVRLPDYTPL